MADKFDQRSLDDYVDVAERIGEFRERHPDGSLRGTFQMLEVGGQAIVAYRAEAFRTPDDQAPGIGSAWELVPGRTPFTRGSELQNAETSAWGRAIIAVGAADAKRGIASRQEVANARAQRNMPPETRADGSATEAELSRMNRGHEPGTWRASGTADNDSWYDQPAPAEAPEDMPGSSVKHQRQGIYISLGRRGIKDHKSAIERLTGRDISEPADMSYNEAIMVKARVDSWDGRTEELLHEFVAERSQAGAN